MAAANVGSLVRALLREWELREGHRKGRRRADRPLSLGQGLDGRSSSDKLLVERCHEQVQRS